MRNSPSIRNSSCIRMHHLRIMVPHTYGIGDPGEPKHHPWMQHRVWNQQRVSGFDFWGTECTQDESDKGSLPWWNKKRKRKPYFFQRTDMIQVSQLILCHGWISPKVQTAGPKLNACEVSDRKISSLLTIFNTRRTPDSCDWEWLREKRNDQMPTFFF